MTKTKKIVTGAVAAVALAVAGLSAAGSTPAEAKHKHHWHKHHYGYYVPYAVAPLAYYGYRYNSCGWTWNKWGKKIYVCY